MRAKFEAAYQAEIEARGLPFDATVFVKQADGDYVIGNVQSAWWGYQAAAGARTLDGAREAFEAAVIERMKESGFLEVEIRVECLARDGEGYYDGSIDAYWHYWQKAWLMVPQPGAAAAAPSYRDLFITTDKVDRTSIFDLPYNLVVTCTRTGGWEIWRLGGNQGSDTKYAGEFPDAGKGLRLDVAGHVIVDSLTSATAGDAE